MKRYGRDTSGVTDGTFFKYWKITVIFVGWSQNLPQIKNPPWMKRIWKENYIPLIFPVQNEIFESFSLRTGQKNIWIGIKKKNSPRFYSNQFCHIEHKQIEPYKLIWRWNLIFSHFYGDFKFVPSVTENFQISTLNWVKISTNRFEVAKITFLYRQRTCLSIDIWEYTRKNVLKFHTHVLNTAEWPYSIFSQLALASCE